MRWRDGEERNGDYIITDCQCGPDWGCEDLLEYHGIIFRFPRDGMVMIFNFISIGRGGVRNSPTKKSLYFSNFL